MNDLPPWFIDFVGEPIVLWMAGLVALVTFLGLVWAKLVRPAMRFLDAARDVAEDWRGVPADEVRGIPARPGVLARLRQLEEGSAHVANVLEQVRHEVLPNSGGSLRDQVDGVRDALTDHLEGRRRLEAELDLARQMHGLVPRQLPAPRPAGDDEGSRGR